ncbi:LemA family protein [Natrialba swarupiae]|nr:LemA family protein [Natrialba swarupiae]
MAWFVTIVLGFAAAIAGYSGLRYVGRVETTVLEASERCDRAWANVDVLLERRHDEVGALIDLAVEHVEHERDVLQELLDARERAIEVQQPEAAAASVEIREAIDDLYAVADEVPALQSADRFDDVRDSLTNIEQRLETRREYYNEAVAAYNVRIRRFPERLVAARHGLERREPFRASATAHEGIDVSDRFGGLARVRMPAAPTGVRMSATRARTEPTIRRVMTGTTIRRERARAMMEATNETEPLASGPPRSEVDA